ncbi:hypothetical protein T05_5417 [Trichinella murrelli]|uniref:Uncharacterized protein n=1 Tax=Trichinella murrelli TaxID=144512 RepID=A0A0V0THB5_9BILA|nr:hypothetical protein T05_5417 [Trichinella murrelli]
MTKKECGRKHSAVVTQESHAEMRRDVQCCKEANLNHSISSEICEQLSVADWRTVVLYPHQERVGNCCGKEGTPVTGILMKARTFKHISERTLHGMLRSINE